MYWRNEAVYKVYTLRRSNWQNERYTIQRYDGGKSWKVKGAGRGGGTIKLLLKKVPGKNSLKKKQEGKSTWEKNILVDKRQLGEKVTERKGTW